MASDRARFSRNSSMAKTYPPRRHEAPDSRQAINYIIPLLCTSIVFAITLSRCGFRSAPRLSGLFESGGACKRSPDPPHRHPIDISASYEAIGPLRRLASWEVRRYRPSAPVYGRSERYFRNASPTWRYPHRCVRVRSFVGLFGRCSSMGGCDFPRPHYPCIAHIRGMRRM